MRLVTFQRRSASRRAGLLLRGNRVLDVSRAYGHDKNDRNSKRRNDTQGLIESLQALSSSILEIIKAGPETIAELVHLEKMAVAGDLEDCIFSLGDSPLVAPIPTPPLLLHFEAHEAHAKSIHAAMHGDAIPFPEVWHQFPLYYVGNPTGLLGMNKEVLFPEGEDQMDFELELAAVLGRDVSGVGAKEAEGAIIGYTIVNDWSARCLQRKSASLGLGPVVAKGFATSMGPCLVTKDELEDPFNLRMTVRINDEVVSSGTTHGARYSFGEMIAYASESGTLPAGTVICSGAFQNGSGAEIGRYLRQGDVVDLEIEGIGTLRNQVGHMRRPAVYTLRT
ncbi:fumarylacetoacetate hydrolase family protein [Candidatus Sumerlaeota bacterium]|nr:fumarylacetoacetate hydrolase family protein [Candidatus Sumerlaeota bacterium]